MKYHLVVLDTLKLMILTGRNYRYCLKYKKEILRKCGKGPKELLTIQDFCKVAKMKVKDLLSVLKAAAEEKAAANEKLSGHLK